VILGQQIVRSHDRRVTADVAIAYEPPLENRDSLDSVISGQMKGGRETMPSRTDHHDIIGLAQGVAGP
jgi:hypothetical protein